MSIGAVWTYFAVGLQRGINFQPGLESGLMIVFIGEDGEGFHGRDYSMRAQPLFLPSRLPAYQTLHGFLLTIGLSAAQEKAF